MQGDTLQQHARDRVEELPGAEIGHPFEPDREVFKIRGKVFMLMTDITGEPIVIVKADPEDSKTLREHWIALNPGGERLQPHARDTAVSLKYVTNGHPFTPRLEVWKVHDKVSPIVTDDDPDLQLITVNVDPLHGVGITKQLIGDFVHNFYDLADDLRRKRQS